ncbi:hypothetical protein M5K25_013157 [Dendrobium thyrsiflorum]|uniref:Uncharacterized protein n=1 Tax=Dendrobium thyrsiflorum TaxID=117978 RepID=A0ABD0USJ8_DENTH
MERGVGTLTRLGEGKNPEVEILGGENEMPPLEPISREEMSIGYTRRGAEFVRRGDGFDRRGADFERRKEDFEEGFGSKARDSREPRSQEASPNRQHKSQTTGTGTATQQGNQSPPTQETKGFGQKPKTHIHKKRASDHSSKVAINTSKEMPNKAPLLPQKEWERPTGKHNIPNQISGQQSSRKVLGNNSSKARDSREPRSQEASPNRQHKSQTTGTGKATQQGNRSPPTQETKGFGQKPKTHIHKKRASDHSSKVAINTSKEMPNKAPLLPQKDAKLQLYRRVYSSPQQFGTVCGKHNPTILSSHSMANRRSNRLLGASRSNSHQSRNQSVSHRHLVSASFHPGGQNTAGEGTSAPSLED